MRLATRLLVFPDSFVGSVFQRHPVGRPVRRGHYQVANMTAPKPVTHHGVQEVAEGYPFPGDFRDGERHKGWQDARPQPRDVVQEASQEPPGSVEAGKIVGGLLDALNP